MIANDKEFIDNGLTFHGSIPRIMGTRLEMLVIGSPEEVITPLWDWLCIEVQYLENVLNRFNPESEVSRINANSGAENQKTSRTLASFVRMAMRYWETTFGLFDVTKGGMSHVKIDEQGSLTLGGHEMDFGGFAKGYVLSQLKDRLSRNGVLSAFVDFGGSSILAMGHHPYGDCWKIGVRNPFGNGILDEVSLKDKSMSTSGNTPLYGSHIINPATGEANTEKKVVTVICDDPLDAEVLSTTLMIADENQHDILMGMYPGAEEKIFYL